MKPDNKSGLNNCGKVAFETFYQAQKVLNRFGNIGRVYGKTKRNHATKKPKRVYKCPDCGKYHLTSQSKLHRIP
jgi:hypothetical protein